MQTPTRLTATVAGHVQGVGFRWWVQRRARELGLAGWARNEPDRTVQVVVEGPREVCEQLLAALRGTGTPGRVRSVTDRWSDATGLHDFSTC
jgi:acylphosphatase